VIPKPFESHIEAVNCDHNYVQQERQFGEDVSVTRRGAVSVKRELAITLNQVVCVKGREAMTALRR
jgi:hypothetical protein